MSMDVIERYDRSSPILFSLMDSDTSENRAFQADVDTDLDDK